MQQLRTTSGFTLIESLLGLVFFATLFVTTFYVIENFNSVQQRERVKNLVSEETQFLLNRIAQMVRENTIDYSEYYSNGLEITDVFGDDPELYEAHFYHHPGCTPGQVDGDPGCDHDDPGRFNEGFFDTGADNDFPNDDASAVALETIAGGTGHRQYELYLLSPDGLIKRILNRTGNGVDDNDSGDIDEDNDTPSQFDPSDFDALDGAERLRLKQMVANDSDSDGIVDEYIDDVASGFTGDGWQTISPQGVDILDLKFYIAPLDDPRKAFNEGTVEAQQQPHVTIVLTTRPSRQWRDQVIRTGEIGIAPITVQTTISSRVLHNVSFPGS